MPYQALEPAAANGHVKVFEFLLRVYKKFEVLLEAAAVQNPLLLGPAAELNRILLRLGAVRNPLLLGPATVRIPILLRRWGYRRFRFDMVLRGAAENGHVAMVKVLLELETTKDVSCALERAVAEGHVEIVQLLISNGNPYRAGEALIAAATKGNTDIVSLLLANDASDSINRALVSASLHGHVDVVNLLFDKADPAKFDITLEEGAPNGQRETLKLRFNVWENQSPNNSVTIRRIVYAADCVEVVKVLAGRSGYSELGLEAATTRAKILVEGTETFDHMLPVAEWGLPETFAFGQVIADYRLPQNMIWQLMKYNALKIEFVLGVSNKRPKFG